MVVVSASGSSSGGGSSSGHAGSGSGSGRGVVVGVVQGWVVLRIAAATGKTGGLQFGQAFGKCSDCGRVVGKT